MTRAEYYEHKKGFEQFKKELKAENKDIPKFVMSYAQYCKHTFTAYLGEITFSYEKRIEDWKPYTEDENNNLYETAKRVVSILEKDKAVYGTVENETNVRASEIVNSAAFRRYSESLGGIRYATEIKTEYGRRYKYLRFTF